MAGVEDVLVTLCARLVTRICPKILAANDEAATSTDPYVLEKPPKVVLPIVRLSDTSTSTSTSFQSFCYKLARRLDYCAKTGRPQLTSSDDFDGSTDVPLPLRPTLVASSIEALDEQRAFPPLSLAAVDEVLNFSTWSELRDEKDMLVVLSHRQHLRADFDLDSLSAAHVLILDDSYSLANPVGWRPHVSSQMISHEYTRMELSISFSSPAHYVLSKDVRAAFYDSATCAFGPEDVDCLKLMTPRRNKSFGGKIVFEGGSNACNDESSNPVEAEKNVSTETASIADTMKVWTQPLESGTVQYAMALLRLSGNMSSLLAQFLPLLFDKVTYLRNTHHELLLEVVEAVEGAILMFVPPFVVSRNSEGLSLDVSIETDLSVMFDAVRLLFRLSADNAAMRVGALAPKLCGSTCIAAHILHGRCLEAVGNIADAKMSFGVVIELQCDHPEATLALQRLSSIGSAGPSGIVAIENVDDTQADRGNNGCNVEENTDEEDGDVEAETDPPNRRQTFWERLALRARQRSHESMGFDCLETNARLSESKMYTLMRNFYEVHGMGAWENGGENQCTDTVPFYITSNPYIALAYVHIALDLILDYHARGCLDISAPVYILELGTGPGKFSSMFLSFLQSEIDTREALSQLHIVYVMTDFTASNVDSWGNDQTFQSHVSSGLLDFAIYDVDDPITHINLIRSGVQLSCETPAINPILAIANYVLDSLRMDAFRVANGRLQEALVSTYVKSSQDGADTANGSITYADPSIPGNIRQEWTYQSVSDAKTYYAADTSYKESNEKAKSIARRLNVNVDELLDKVLNEYVINLKNKSTFTLPVSGMRVVQTLRTLSRSGCVSMLIADKGFNRFSMLCKSGDPIVNLHGSLSMSVNLHALSRFAKYLARSEGVGASVFHTPQQNSALDITLLNVGLRGTPSRAASSFVDWLCLFGVYDLFTVRDHVEDIAAGAQEQNRTLSAYTDNDATKAAPINEGMSMPLIMTLVRLSRWDPDLLWQFGDKLSDHLREKDIDNTSCIRDLTRNFQRFMAVYISRFDPGDVILQKYRHLLQLLNEHEGSHTSRRNSK